MLIIVEGVEGIGKTTLCEGISRETGFPVYKTFGKDREFLPSEFRNLFIEAFNNGLLDYVVTDFIRQVSCDVIFDRSQLSLYPYGGLSDDEKCLALSRRWANLISKEDYLVLYLYANDTSVAQNRRKARVINAGRIRDMQEQHRRYLYLLDELKLRNSQISIDGLSSEEVLRRALKEIL